MTLGATPPWVENLIRLRNHLAKPFGIAPVAPLGRLGSPPQGAWRPGDRFSMFTIDSVADDEIVLTIADAHLDVWISFLRRAGGPEASYVIASLVRTHNRVGAVYMWPVGIVHPLLVIGMMARLPV